MKASPNILYIFTDQQCAAAMGCAGNPHVNTPALDRIAADGLRFDAAYTSYPLCVPARMSMMTGRMPHEMGINVNVHVSETPCPFTMLGRRLAAAGYRTHYVGKWHLTVPESDHAQHGFEQVVLGGGYGGLDSDKATAAIDYINNAPNDPFFLTVSFNNPHDVCELARGDKLRMGELPPLPPDSELPPVPANWDASEDEPEVLRAFQREHPRPFCAYQWSELEVRRFRWGYYRLIEMVDREIGRVLEALEKNGLSQNTVIVFSSDHGDGQGAHRWNQKWCHYDESSRVPFILVDPEGRRAGEIESTPVSATLDLFPTLCDYAGVETPHEMRGRSLQPLFSGGIVDRDFVPSEVSFGLWAKMHEDAWPKARMIRTEHYKYIAYDSGNFREQLFDMQRDPGEMQNLAGAPAYANLLAEHRRHLADWVDQTADSFDLESAI